MNENEWLAEQFESYRIHLRGVAYRMLGSLGEADDAVQASWFRLTRADTTAIENLRAWLTTVVARVCLDMLRSRKSRREESLDDELPEPMLHHEDDTDPEHEALMADSVGLALLVVLETLTPAERLTFVLHDMFAIPFDEIAPIVGRTPTAARQIARRARRRVQGAATLPNPDLTRQREVVTAFLTAARGGDFNALLAVLDPDVVLRSDETAAIRSGIPAEVRGAAIVANRAIQGGARVARPALVNGAVGVVIAPHGHLVLVLSFTINQDGKIIAIDTIADHDRLHQLDLAVLND